MWSRAMSKLGPSSITCDAGHKAVAADAGAPTCAAFEFPELRPQRPSEERFE